MLLLIVVSYVMGSIPTGYWLTRALKGIDIRNYGSGSTGATNVWRCVGKGPGISVFFIDLAKGLIPVRLAIALTLLPNFQAMDQYHLLPVLAALAALIGHSKSVFLNFQGGKSAATGLGTLLALKPIVGTATFATWLLLLFAFKIVSLASIIATGFCGVYMALAKMPVSYVVYCILGFAYVTYRHKANIERMLKGTEPRIGKKGADLTRLPDETQNASSQLIEPKNKA
jgi:glycerol-3-phosphate acyltransferase PlsY